MTLHPQLIQESLREQEAELNRLRQRASVDRASLLVGEQSPAFREALALRLAHHLNMIFWFETEGLPAIRAELKKAQEERNSCHA